MHPHICNNIISTKTIRLAMVILVGAEVSRYEAGTLVESPGLSNWGGFYY